MSKELTNYDYANGDRINNVIGDNFDELKKSIDALTEILASISEKLDGAKK